MTRRHLDWNICNCWRLAKEVALHTGAAYVLMDRRMSL